MRKESFDLKSDNLFPFHFHLFGIVLIIVGAVSIISSPYLSPIFLLAGLLILTAFRGIEFNKLDGSYKIYNSILFIKTGKWESFENAVFIYVNKSRVTQKINTRVNDGPTIEHVEYDAYLQLGDDSNIYLLTNQKKNKLLEKLENLAKYFGVDIRDNTN